MSSETNAVQEAETAFDKGKEEGQAVSNIVTNPKAVIEKAMDKKTQEMKEQANKLTGKAREEKMKAIETLEENRDKMVDKISAYVQVFGPIVLEEEGGFLGQMTATTISEVVSEIPGVGPIIGEALEGVFQQVVAVKGIYDEAQGRYQEVQDRMDDVQDKIQRVQNIDLKGNVEQGIMNTMNKRIDEAHKEADKKIKTTRHVVASAVAAEKNRKIEAHVQKAKNDLNNHLQKKKGRAGGGNGKTRRNKARRKRSTICAAWWRTHEALETLALVLSGESAKRFNVDFKRTMKKPTKKGRKTYSKKRKNQKRKTKKKRKQRKNKRNRSTRTR